MLRARSSIDPPSTNHNSRRCRTSAAIQVMCAIRNYEERRRPTVVDIEDLKARFLDLEFDRTNFEIDADAAVTIARVSGETRPEYTDSEHPDFQATPALIGSLASGRHLPIDFPKLDGIPMDGGKAVNCFKPVRPGTPITGRAHLHEIYDKNGRSGRMVFIVSRMKIYDANDEHLATSDSRMVIRERPDA
jgi:hypothetical protein